MTQHRGPHQPWTAEGTEQIIRRHAGRKGALLPILHDIQEAFGYVPDEAVPILAAALNQSRAEIHGSISFYHDFKRKPEDRPVIKLCRAEACQARGVDRIAPTFERDSRIALETVYCLGLCASGPAAMVGEHLYARLDDTTARQLIDEVAA